MADITMAVAINGGKPALSENVFTPISQDRFDPPFLDKLRERNPLEFLIGQSVQLKRSGSKSQIGLCPFHIEKTPSFHVYEQHYHCFGCGAHGDAIEFVMMRDNFSFPQAVQTLATHAGMQMPGQEPQPITAEDKAARKQQERERERKIEARQIFQRRQKQSREAAIAKMAEEIWAAAGPAPASHPYLRRKGIDPHGMRISDKGELLVDMRDPEGKLWNLQMIASSGKKITLWRKAGEETEGGRMMGLSHVLGTLEDAGGVIVTEGVATGISVHQATGFAVVIAFTSNNLAGTVRDLRAKFPGLPLVVAADNDHRKERLDPPKPNVGLLKAQEAVKGVLGSLVLVPTFQPSEDGKDWNDYSGVHGPKSVQVLFEDAVARLTAKPAVVAKPAKKVPSVLPEGLLDVGGALGQLTAWFYATSISPQPFLNLAAAITAVGVLAGRRYRSPTNLRTNIYAVGIADSGGGKDHARKQIKEAFLASGLGQYLGGEDIASGAAMMTAIQRFPCQLFQIDEFGDWLDGVLSKQANQHKKQIAANLKKLYTSANSTLGGTEYADQGKLGKPREDLIEPHACLYGTTTPKQLWDAIAAGSMNDGFMARFLICVTPENYPPRQRPAQTPPPPALIEALQAIARGVDDPEAGNLASLMSHNLSAHSYTVPYDLAADKAIEAMSDEQNDRLNDAEGGHVNAALARWVENTIKLALIAAVSRNPQKPVITLPDVIWGRLMATYCMDTLLVQAGRNIADNDYERRQNKVLEILRRTGQPMTERELMRKGFRLPDKERAELLKTLVDAGLIEASTTEGGNASGRPTTRYAMPDEDI